MKKHLSLLFLKYLRFLARLQLVKSPNLTVIGITGSAGKTSTILACQAALKSKYKIKTTAGSNSESGIPLNILGLQATDYSLFNWLRLGFLAPIKLVTNWKKYDLYLVEMGIDAPFPPQNMDYLLSIVKPKIAIFLNVTPVHLRNFQSLNQIAQEKAKLANSAQTAIINSADPLVVKYTQSQNTIHLKPIAITFKRYLLPDIYQISFGAAVTLAKTLGLDQKTAIDNIKKYFHLPPSRSSILKGIHHSTIIDSSYNSSPLACTEMLKFLSKFPSPRVAILGDMRELGQSSSISHRQIYQKALKTSDIIISVGPQTKKYFGPKAKKFLYWWQAADYITHHLPPKATILIKGSQNTIYLEELIKPLLQNPSDSRKLCRQSPYWLKTKQNFRKSTP